MINRKLGTCFLLTGALLLPLAGHAANSGEQSGGDSSSGSVLKDSLITAKIKGAFATDPQVSALNIKVETDEQGVVQLSGQARSKAEAKRAQDIALHTADVRLVENRIQFGEETGSNAPSPDGRFASDSKKPAEDR